MCNQSDCLNRLQALGISWDDAVSLRRISMTLHRWHELECGTDGGCIERGRLERVVVAPHPAPRKKVFISDENGKPYFTVDTGFHGVRDHIPTPDRERGALDRLARIMKDYPDLIPYVQGDPRGASLYVCRKADIPAGGSIDAYYSRGVAVYK